MCLKTCNKCRVKKPEKDFPIESGRGYRKTTCRLCIWSVRKVRDEIGKRVEPPSDDHQWPICQWCNRTLGGLKDDFGALDRIRTYLKKGRE